MSLISGMVYVLAEFPSVDVLENWTDDMVSFHFLEEIARSKRMEPAYWTNHHIRAGWGMLCCSKTIAAARPWGCQPEVPPIELPDDAYMQLSENERIERRRLTNLWANPPIEQWLSCRQCQATWLYQPRWNRWGMFLI